MAIKKNKKAEWWNVSHSFTWEFHPRSPHSVFSFGTVLPLSSTLIARLKLKIFRERFFCRAFCLRLGWTEGVTNVICHDNVGQIKMAWSAAAELKDMTPGGGARWEWPQGYRADCCAADLNFIMAWSKNTFYHFGLNGTFDDGKTTKEGEKSRRSAIDSQSSSRMSPQIMRS